jgi:hypothetical protein
MVKPEKKLAKKKTEKVAEAEASVIVAYKGFDADWKCRGHQFEVGKTYEHKGAVIPCESGWHACENPLDVWSYYGPCDVKFASVEMSGEIKRHSGDSKLASAKIAIKAELSLPQFIGDAVNFLMALCKDVKADAEGVQAASGHYSKLAASGHYSQLAASGHYSKLAASGKSSIAVAANVECTAKVGELGCIALTRWVDSEKRYRVTVGYVGENNIKADTWYSLDAAGEFVEVAA